MNAIETILSNLAALQGSDAVRKACHRFYLGKIPVAMDESIADLSDVESSVSSNLGPKKRGRPAKSSSQGQKAKKERKPRGQTSWNKLVEATLKEMREVYKIDYPEDDDAAVAKAVPYKMAFEEAGKRKRASDPEAQRRFDERKAAKQAAKAAKHPPLPPSGKTSQTMRTGSESVIEDAE